MARSARKRAFPLAASARTGRGAGHVSSKAARAILLHLQPSKHHMGLRHVRFPPPGAIYRHFSSVGAGVSRYGGGLMTTPHADPLLTRELHR